MSYERSVTLHQQDGGLSIQAFAEREGLTPGQVMRSIRSGKVLGARKDVRSKHWWIYPPAKLTERPRCHQKRSAADTAAADLAGIPASAESPGLLPRGSAVAGEAGADSGQPGQHAPQVEAEGMHPPVGQQAPQGRAGGCSSVYRSPEMRSICQTLREAAARQYREGIHYLRLNAREFAQLYAALSNDRSRVRKLVGKGLLPVGLLRASDSTWQKMQAMCHEGRLL